VAPSPSLDGRLQACCGCSVVDGRSRTRRPPAGGSTRNLKVAALLCSERRDPDPFAPFTAASTPTHLPLATRTPRRVDAGSTSTAAGFPAARHRTGVAMASAWSGPEGPDGLGARRGLAAPIGRCPRRDRHPTLAVPCFRWTDLPRDRHEACRIGQPASRPARRARRTRRGHARWHRTRRCRGSRTSRTHVAAGQPRPFDEHASRRLAASGLPDAQVIPKETRACRAGTRCGTSTTPQERVFKSFP